MVKLKVSEATNTQLDWLVGVVNEDKNYGVKDWLEQRRYDSAGRYTTDWSQMGPIIERERIDLRSKINAGSDVNEWRADVGVGIKSRGRYGPTPLIAAARCYVVSKLGEEVEIPEELYG